MFILPTLVSSTTGTNDQVPSARKYLVVLSATFSAVGTNPDKYALDFLLVLTVSGSSTPNTWSLKILSKSRAVFNLPSELT